VSKDAESEKLDEIDRFSVVSAATATLIHLIADCNIIVVVFA